MIKMWRTAEFSLTFIYLTMICLLFFSVLYNELFIASVDHWLAFEELRPMVEIPERDTKHKTSWFLWVSWAALNHSSCKKQNEVLVFTSLTRITEVEVKAWTNLKQFRSFCRLSEKTVMDLGKALLKPRAAFQLPCSLHTWIEVRPGAWQHFTSSQFCSLFSLVSSFSKFHRPVFISPHQSILVHELLGSGQQKVKPKKRKCFLKMYVFQVSVENNCMKCNCLLSAPLLLVEVLGSGFKWCAWSVGCFQRTGIVKCEENGNQQTYGSAVCRFSQCSRAPRRRLSRGRRPLAGPRLLRGCRAQVSPVAASPLSELPVIWVSCSRGREQCNYPEACRA